MIKIVILLSSLIICYLFYQIKQLKINISNHNQLNLLKKIDLLEQNFQAVKEENIKLKKILEELIIWKQNNEMNNYCKVIKTIHLNSQWKKIQILDISKLGGITVDLTKKKPIRKKILKKINELGNKIVNNESESDNDDVKNNSVNFGNYINTENVISTTHKNKKLKNDISKFLNEKEEIDQKLTFSLQIKLLPKSTLIFITASIYILNQTQKDIYIYYLPIEKKDEEELDLYNIQDAEDTRNRAYKFMKDTIEQMKETI